MMLTPSGAVLGLAGAVPLLVFGFSLDKTNWEWVKKVDEITRGITVQLFGTKRQVRCCTLLSLEDGNLYGCHKTTAAEWLIQVVLVTLPGTRSGARYYLYLP